MTLINSGYHGETGKSSTSDRKNSEKKSDAPPPPIHTHWGETDSSFLVSLLAQVIPRRSSFSHYPAHWKNAQQEQAIPALP